MPSNLDLLNDPAFGAGHDDDAAIDAAELGNNGDVDPDADADPDDVPVKKDPPAKKTAKKPDDEDDDPDKDNDKGDEKVEDPDKAKLAQKLARAGRARERLENELREARAKLQAHESKMSDKARETAEKLNEKLDDLYEKVEDHRARGEVKEAARVQREIDKINSEATRQQAAHLALTESIRQTETRAFNTMVAQLEAYDPRFDKDHEDFDEEITRDVGELTEAYEAKGLTATEALRKACKTVLREDVFAPKRGIAREEKPKDKGAPAAKKPEARSTDVKRNIDTAKKTPPDAPDVRKEKASELPDMETISEADFDALPESTLRRLLGNE